MNTVRETIFGAVYFGVYELSKRVLKERFAASTSIPGSYSSLLAIQLAGKSNIIRTVCIHACICVGFACIVRMHVSDVTGACVLVCRLLIIFFSRRYVGHGRMVRKLPTGCSKVKYSSREESRGMSYILLGLCTCVFHC